MSGATSYLVLRRDAAAEIEVKRSRFLATLVRVDSEDAARAVVERLRKEHWDARHHCSAIIVGPPPTPVQRSSDDGEPAGTAGAPMLEVLRGAGLSDTVAVVTRWFGGTLLGAGGLVRAYGDAVRAALDAAGTRERRLRLELALEVDHADAGRVEGELRARGVDVLGTTWGAAVQLVLGVDPAAEAATRALVAEVTGGTAEASTTGQRWVDA
ncbi:IMPACT family member YigZ [Nocardioides dokdonensis FR1436]|uniref:IMPACT family member YigZ n=1 Tax=Nocardioides dokdonensis FR1436 TaxID=1300347 RepID=A0A1A9GLT2_9ACTN|nr:YigZ family protein [Nocardioides dokdonensis]ANH38441.1 IMPACT family member YigZ [Nocardioides dokdonensis FR1436]